VGKGFLSPILELGGPHNLSSIFFSSRGGVGVGTRIEAGLSRHSLQILLGEKRSREHRLHLVVKLGMNARTPHSD
jgi:hypothetical protein